MILYIFLSLSVGLNILLFWYLKEVVKRFSLYERESKRLLSVIDDYIEHITSVYEMSMYYGDATLKGLLQHTTDLKNELSMLREIFILDSLDEISEEQIEKEEQ